MCYCCVLWLYWECSWLTTAEQIYLQVQIKLPDKSSETRKGNPGGSSGLRSSKLMNLTSLTRSDSGRPADLSEVLWELRQLIKQTSLKELSAVNRTYEINGKGRFETSADELETWVKRKGTSSVSHWEIPIGTWHHRRLNVLCLALSSKGQMVSLVAFKETKPFQRRFLFLKPVSDAVWWLWRCSGHQ